MFLIGNDLPELQKSHESGNVTRGLDVPGRWTDPGDWKS